MIPLRYTLEDSERAHNTWGASCGPHSLAAALGLTLEEVRTVLPNFKGWMNPTMMTRALLDLKRVHNLRHHLKTQEPCEGICRVQWEGSWLNPGVPPAAAYHHTHWIAHRDGHVLCTATVNDEWVPFQVWKAYLQQAGKPWHFTHHYILP